MNIRLRPVEPADLPVLFEQQRDPESNRLAAVKPRDAETFNRHWQKLLADPTITPRAIVLDDAVVGTVGFFPLNGENAVGYWIAREFWGRGLASQALAVLLQEVPERPLVAWVARENAASIRVLEKCGFRLTGSLESPESDRFLACTELIYRLE